MPNRLAAARHHALGIEPTVVQRMQDLAAAGQRLSAAVAADLMKELYRGLVNDQAHRFAELFEHLLQAEGPLVFHCTAGKDRTGFAAALILHALGVPRAVVMQDYLLTNALYQPPPLPRSDTPAEALAVLWRVQAGFLRRLSRCWTPTTAVLTVTCSSVCGWGPRPARPWRAVTWSLLRAPEAVVLEVGRGRSRGLTASATWRLARPRGATKGLPASGFPGLAVSGGLLHACRAWAAPGPRGENSDVHQGAAGL